MEQNFFLNIKVLPSKYEKSLSHNTFILIHLRLITFDKMTSFSKSVFFIVIKDSSLFQLRNTFSSDKFLFLSNWTIALYGTSFSKEKYTTFVIAKVWSTKTSLSYFTCHILHNLNIFSFLRYFSYNSQRLQSFYYMKNRLLKF